LFPDFAWCPSFGNGGTTVKGAVQGTPNVTLTSGITWGVNAGPPPEGNGGETPIYNGTSHAGTSSATINLTGVTKVTLGWWMYWDSFANDDDLAFEGSTNSYAGTVPGALFCDPNESGSTTFVLSVSGTTSTHPNYCSFTRPSGAAWHNYVVSIDLASFQTTDSSAANCSGGST
jgi:hypothetical protein